MDDFLFSTNRIMNIEYKHSYKTEKIDLFFIIVFISMIAFQLIKNTH